MSFRVVTRRAISVTSGGYHSSVEPFLVLFLSKMSCLIPLSLS